MSLIIAVILPYATLNFTVLFLTCYSIAHSVYSVRYFYTEGKFLFLVAFNNLGSIFLLVALCPDNYEYVERYMI